MFALAKQASATVGLFRARLAPGTGGRLRLGPALCRSTHGPWAVDFTGLVYLTRALLTEVDDAGGGGRPRTTWCSWMKSDTLSEYEVMRVWRHKRQACASSAIRPDHLPGAARHPRPPRTPRARLRAGPSLHDPQLRSTRSISRSPAPWLTPCPTAPTACGRPRGFRGGVPSLTHHRDRVGQRRDHPRTPE